MASLLLLVNRTESRQFGWMRDLHELARAGNKLILIALTVIQNPATTNLPHERTSATIYLTCWRTIYPCLKPHGLRRGLQWLKHQLLAQSAASGEA